MRGLICLPDIDALNTADGLLERNHFFFSLAFHSHSNIW